MTAIAREPLEFETGGPWARVVAQVGRWADAHAVAVRDAIVLLPFAQHLSPARRAWAAAGGWMPRIETTLTLARSLGPALPAPPGQITLDAALDRLAARRLLRMAAGSAGWARRDPQSFEHAADAVVQTAHALVRAVAAVPPAERDAHWRAGRELLGGTGPGAAERVLARVALEWAATAPPPSTDVLRTLRPSAWIVLQAGGPEPLALSLMHSSDDVPCLLLDADVPLAEPFVPLAARVDVAVGMCSDIEDEAQRTAAQVIAEIDAGHVPVALIAQDRLLVRRVRALLSRQQVSLQDETGWKLSTTRAAATVAALLRAGARAASTDAWLDWLKSCAAGWPGLEHGDVALQALESHLRHRGWTAPASVDETSLHERAAALWRAARQVVATLADGRTQTCAEWGAALRGALQACGAWPALQADDAGRQVIAALHLADAGGDGDPMTLDDYTAWVLGALEDASFVPEAPADADVVITPLERAMLRPFGSAVMPGADEKRLGGAGMPHALLGDTVAGALRVPTASLRRDAETLAFAQLLCLPRVTLLRRRDDGGEPLAPSPLLERLVLAMRRAGRAPAAAPDPRRAVAIPAQPVQRPQPVAADLLPPVLSASACEALRMCPYRFFALRLLQLREADELDEDAEKSDYGSWLHAVLHRFHAQRAEPRTAEEDEAHLRAVALEVQRDMHLEDPSFLPYLASFARIAPRYVAWVQREDRQGARWLAGEADLTAHPSGWGGIAMQGRIDRIDRLPGATRLVDYKTSPTSTLKKRVADPQEDTQLAFYAALVAQQPDAPAALEAVYLPLDDSDTLKAVPHDGVADTARQLVQALGHELARVRGGAALPALGEGVACDYCAARGLCRRDHWAADEAQR
jgi:ATP-dependent helicase/nuclease subunit B